MCKRRLRTEIHTHHYSFELWSYFENYPPPFLTLPSRYISQHPLWISPQPQHHLSLVLSAPSKPLDNNNEFISSRQNSELGKVFFFFCHEGRRGVKRNRGGNEAVTVERAPSVKHFAKLLLTPLAALCVTADLPRQQSGDPLPENYLYVPLSAIFPRAN